jgi:hypothetical protein
LSFYERTGTNFTATPATVGPWNPGWQHGSPPVALLGHALEEADRREGMIVAQLSVQFFGPVPVRELSIETETVRPGARVEHRRARLVDGARACVEASAWCMATARGRVPAAGDWAGAPPLPPAQAPRLFADVPSFGYGESLDWRFVEGSFDTLGPATVWARSRLPLLPDEPLSPLGRLLIMVDAANGVGAALPLSRFLFVPIHLAVAVVRHPRGEWVGMRAGTLIDDHGVGLTRAELFDTEGTLGLALQSLFVVPRDEI